MATLLERIQNRIKSTSTAAGNNSDLTIQNKPRLSNSNEFDDNGNSSESDIDDDISINQCQAMINNKNKNSSYNDKTFTKVRDRKNKQISETSSLQDVLSKRLSNKEDTILTDTSNNLFKNDIPKYNVKEDNNTNFTESISNLETDSYNYHHENSSASSIENNIYTSIRTETTSSNFQIIDQYVPARTNVQASEVVDYNNIKINTSPQVKRKRGKLTDQEKQAAKDAKEREKLDKQHKREELKREKEWEKERQKALKRVVTLNNRSERKDECMEKLLALVDPLIVQEEGGADVLKCLQDLNVRYELKTLPMSSCIGWLRENIDYKISEGSSEIQKKSSYEEVQHIIHRMTATELAIRVNAQLKNLAEEETLQDLINQLQTSFPNKKYTLVVMAMNKYFNFVKTKENQKFRNQALGNDPEQQPAKRRRKKNGNEVPLLKKKEIDEVLVSVQLMSDISIRVCEDKDSFSSFVCSFTKSVAEAPFKKQYDSALQFTSNGGSFDKSSIKLGNDGHGLLQLWNQQLQQFYGVRHDTSVAITQVYPSPHALMKAYDGLSEQEGMQLLQDVEIRRGVGVLQTQRRIGPELSKRLYKLFTSINGDENLAR